MGFGDMMLCFGEKERKKTSQACLGTMISNTGAGQTLNISQIAFHSKWMAAASYVFLFGFFVWADFRRNQRDLTKRNCLDLLLYFPFMLAFPFTTYQYSLVILIPLIPYVSLLWNHASRRIEKRILLLLTTGICLTQFQVVALETLFEDRVYHLIPSLGLLLIMVSAIGWLFLRWKATFTPD